MNQHFNKLRVEGTWNCCFEGAGGLKHFISRLAKALLSTALRTRVIAEKVTPLSLLPEFPRSQGSGNSENK
jgi:hypothetical protein